MAAAGDLATDDPLSLSLDGRDPEPGVAGLHVGGLCGRPGPTCANPVNPRRAG
ncbi:hypothetical protein [Nocardia testacea]|uniref:hypothetical protein n=1 Tax=Nocardia testacea TaxID=248551 RepID=UPI003A8893BD